MGYATVQLFCWSTGMGYALKSYVRCARARLIFDMADCTLIALKADRRVCIHSMALSFAHCAHCRDQVLTYS